MTIIDRIVVLASSKQNAGATPRLDPVTRHFERSAQREESLLCTRPAKLSACRQLKYYFNFACLSQDVIFERQRPFQTSSITLIAGMPTSKASLELSSPRPSGQFAIPGVRA